MTKNIILPKNYHIGSYISVSRKTYKKCTQMYICIAYSEYFELAL